MAKMIDISTELTPARWLNLDNVLVVESVKFPSNTIKNVVPHVRVHTEAGDAGFLLPPHITLAEVLKVMQS